MECDGQTLRGAGSTVRIAVLLPDLLGTYGDRGNAIVLAHRLRLRGYGAEIVDVPSHKAIPASCDIYLLGGGEDMAQHEAIRVLERSAFPSVVERGATVLAVCAGLQILGTTAGAEQRGLGLIDVSTTPGTRRAVGETVARALPGIGLAEPVLTGFENHSGRTVIGPGARPLATIVTGIGNGDGTEGAVSGSIIATYLHGPVLARNPQLADRLLATATGDTLAPLPLAAVEQLRGKALSSARRGRFRRAALIPRRWANPGIPADPAAFGQPGDDW